MIQDAKDVSRLKDNYEIEPYLNNRLPAKYVTLMSNLIISAHKLKIERGRYTKRHTKLADERHCMVCRTGDIKDEIIFYATVKDINSFDQSLFVT